MNLPKIIAISLGCSMVATVASAEPSVQTMPTAKEVRADAAQVIPTGPPVIVNQIEIKVGNEIITTVEIEAPLEQLQHYLKQEFRGEALQEKMIMAREEHVKKLIEGKLLLLEARQQKIEIPDAMVKENAEKEIEQLKSKFPSEEAFRKQLAIEHLNEYELLRQREKLVRENLMRQKLLQQKLQEFKTGAEISDETLKEYYEKNKEKFHSPGRARIKQIYVERPSTNLSNDDFMVKDNQAQAKISEARRLLQQGRTFAAVASQYSEHKLSAERGGDIGWIEAGDLGFPELEKAIFKQLALGALSDVVDTARGYFLIKVMDRQDGQTIPFEEVRGRIRQSVMAEGSEKRYNTWIESLKDNYKVVYAKK